MLTRGRVVVDNVNARHCAASVIPAMLLSTNLGSELWVSRFSFSDEVAVKGGGCVVVVGTGQEIFIIMEVVEEDAIVAEEVDEDVIIVEVDKKDVILVEADEEATELSWGIVSGFAAPLLVWSSTLL